MEFLSFCDLAKVLAPSIKIIMLTFVLKKYNVAFRVYIFFENTGKTFILNLVLLVVLVLESKGLY